MKGLGRKRWLWHVPCVVTLVAFITPAAMSQTWKDLLDKANAYQRAQKLDSAIILGRLALNQVIDEEGTPDTSTATVLIHLGGYSSNLHRFVEAESAWTAALSIFVRRFGEKHIASANLMHNLAICHLRTARYAEAEQLLMKALRTTEELVPTDSPTIGMRLLLLSQVYAMQAKYEKAESTYKKLIALWRKANMDVRHMALTYNNLAILYSEQHRFPEAEVFLKKALAIKEADVNKNNLSLVNTLMNLGSLYRTVGRAADAEALFVRANAILENILGTQHETFARGLFELAQVYAEQGRMGDAKQLYDRSLKILMGRFGTEHDWTAHCLRGLGAIHARYREHNDARQYFDKALPIYEKILGDNHPQVATTLNDLALLSLDEGNTRLAHDYLNRAMSIRVQTLGSSHPDVAQTFEAYASLYRLEKDPLKGLEAAARAFRIRTDVVRVVSSAMSERDALLVSRHQQDAVNRYFSCFGDVTGHGRKLSEAGDIVLAAKGGVSNGVFRRQDFVASERNPATRELSTALREVNVQISNLYFREVTEKKELRLRPKIDSLRKIADDLESDLARRSASFRKARDLHNITTTRIASLLPPNSTLVEFFKYDHLSLNADTAVAHYIVCVLDKGGKPFIKDLGEAEQIDQLVDRYRKHFLDIASTTLSESHQADYNSISSRLYRLIWKPIESRIKKDNTLFIAPDGGLNLISFGGLQLPDSEYLVERHPIHYLSAGRDLIRLRTQAKSASGFVAFGDPDYDAPVAARWEKGREVAAVDTTEDELTFAANVRSGCSALSDINLRRLTLTGAEAMAVAEYWKKDFIGSEVQVFTQRSSSEENFKKSTPGTKAIHLATHGFFINDDCLPKEQRKSLLADATFRGENPLLLSGVFLAGANLHGKGADEVGAEDGILTALEVSTMNLHGTDLVVLSACESGLGEVKQGEGVYGLRRAFQLAGARTVVSSLWQIPNRETMMFMKELYAQKANTYPELLRRAALQRLDVLRRQGLSTHPYTWGAFVATGDWRITRR